MDMNSFPVQNFASRNMQLTMCKALSSARTLYNPLGMLSLVILGGLNQFLDPERAAYWRSELT